MTQIFEFIPTLITAAFSMLLLLIVSGSRFSRLKTFLIVIPITFTILLVNTFVFEFFKFEEVLIWNILGVFIPEALLVFIIGKRKGLSLFTGIINAFLLTYFVVLIVVVGMNFADNELLFRGIVYVTCFPLAAIYLNFFYNKLHNIVESSLPKMLWLLLLYGVAMFVEIGLYQNIVNTTSQNILKINVFSLALLSVYTVSIVGFYMFLKSYQKELINNFDTKILNKQIENIMEISELKAQSDNELRILRHDMKHVLITLSSLINNGEIEQAQELINSYNVSIENTKRKRYCNDSLINSVLEYYEQQCANNDIKFSTKINNFEELLTIPSNEIIVVISNCLDNAINASLKLKNNRSVTFIFLNNNGRLILQIKNKYDGNISFDTNNLPTNDNEEHGFGTKSIELFAKRNNITLDYAVTKTTFEITLLFNE